MQLASGSGGESTAIVNLQKAGRSGKTDWRKLRLLEHYEVVKHVEIGASPLRAISKLYDARVFRSGELWPEAKNKDSGKQRAGGKFGNLLPL